MHTRSTAADFCKILLFSSVALFLISQACHAEIIVKQKSTNQRASTLIGAPDMTRLRNGDLILRRGRSFLSLLISAVGPGHREFSHGGIFIRRNGASHVVHTLPKSNGGTGFVKTVPLEEFIAPRNSSVAAAYRVVGLNEADERKIITLALNYAHDETPFDDQFDLSDQRKLYCTELIHAVFKAAGVVIVKKPHQLNLAATLVAGAKTKAVITAGQIVISEKTRFIMKFR